MQLNLVIALPLSGMRCLGILRPLPKQAQTENLQPYRHLLASSRKSAQYEVIWKMKLPVWQEF